jgi:protein AroM
MKPKMGMITVGQSPRVDIVPAMARYIGADIEIVERGALDGLFADEILSMTPRADEDRLCTRLADGKQVIVVKEKIIDRIQAKIRELNEIAVELIVLLCTGHFPRFESRCLVVEAEKIVDRCVQALVDDRHRLGLVVPLPEQMAGAGRKQSHVTPAITVVSASPYGPLSETQEAAEQLAKQGVDLVVLHCMGFSDEHRRIMRQTTGKPVLVANSMVARTLAEILVV